jgi:hypothetical protein
MIRASLTAGIVEAVSGVVRVGALKRWPPGPDRSPLVATGHDLCVDGKATSIWETAMSLSMYQASVPVYIRMLTNLIAILEKAAGHCEAGKIDPSVLINYRLYPDMFNFAKQVQIAADAAKNGTAYLAGVEAPKFEDTEKSFPELIERVRKTITFLQAFEPEQIDGSEERQIQIKRGDKLVDYRGQDLLLTRTMPNFYFHVTTAYDILRHNGVALGKRDYLGG